MRVRSVLREEVCVDELPTPLHSMHASHTCPFWSVHRIFRTGAGANAAHSERAAEVGRVQPCGVLVDDLKQNPAVDKPNSLAALEAILRRG